MHARHSREIRRGHRTHHSPVHALLRCDNGLKIYIFRKYNFGYNNPTRYSPRFICTVDITRIGIDDPGFTFIKSFVQDQYDGGYHNDSIDDHDSRHRDRMK